jgi:hypothetical protein
MLMPRTSYTIGTTIQNKRRKLNMIMNYSETSKTN